MSEIRGEVLYASGPDMFYVYGLLCASQMMQRPGAWADPAEVEALAERWASWLREKTRHAE